MVVYTETRGDGPEKDTEEVWLERRYAGTCGLARETAYSFPQVVDWVRVTKPIKISLKSGRGGIGDKLVSDQSGDEEERETKDKHIPVLVS